MNIVIFDTETTSLEKPFCYNIGYVIVNSDNWNIITKKSFVVEQVWHNLPLFSSAYYADKRPIYISEMKAKKTTMDKFGYICQKMIKDFKNYLVVAAYAYNSSFDEKVFNFNCDWYKCNNPFDNIPIYDIRGLAHEFIVDDFYKDFCEQENLFTESGNYSTTAETMFKFITKDTDFIEEHTALSDSIIESEILYQCYQRGAKLNYDYKAKRSIERKINKTLCIKTVEQTHFYFDYSKIKINKDKTYIELK